MMGCAYTFLIYYEEKNKVFIYFKKKMAPMNCSNNKKKLIEAVKIKGWGKKIIDNIIFKIRF